MARDFTAFFSNGGIPKTGLSPTIDVYRVDTGAQVVTGAAMTEVGAGWYKYSYSAADDSVGYVATADGGATLNNAYRYAAGATEAETAERISDVNWDEGFGDHEGTDSMGFIMKLVRALVTGNMRQLNSQWIVYDPDAPSTPLVTFNTFNQSDVAADSSIYNREKV